MSCGAPRSRMLSKSVRYSAGALGAVVATASAACGPDAAKAPTGSGGTGGRGSGGGAARGGHGAPPPGGKPAVVGGGPPPDHPPGDTPLYEKKEASGFESLPPRIPPP